MKIEEKLHCRSGHRNGQSIRSGHRNGQSINSTMRVAKLKTEVPKGSAEIKHSCGSDTKKPKLQNL